LVFGKGYAEIQKLLVKLQVIDFPFPEPCAEPVEALSKGTENQ